MSAPDPYKTLGVSRSAADAEIRAAYRRLVQLHHPDHNGGSKESARRFEEVQDAYAQVRKLRTGKGSPPPRRSAGRSGRASADAGGRAGTAGGEGGLDARLAEMEREVKAAAAAARQRAAQASRDAQQAMRDARDTLLGGERGGDRPSDEELGYYKTDDSLGKIFNDAAADLSERFSGANRARAADRLADAIEDLGSRLSGERHKDES
jgi:curved DNA-binding protein CbpA